MRVALITDGIMPFVTGGMQKHSSYLAKYLTLNNCEVTLFHSVNTSFVPTDLEVNKSIFNGANKLKKIETFIFPKSFWFPGHYFYNSYKYSKMVYKSLINNIDDYDFIYIKGLAGWKLLNERKNIKSITKFGINFHGMNMFLPVKALKLKLASIFFKIIVKKIMFQSDFVFSYGSKVTETILKIGLPKAKIIEIPTGIEEHHIKQEKEINVNNVLRFVFVGRNDPVKALNEVFTAIKTINRNKFHFDFVGPIDNKLQQENILYHGLISNNKKIIEILDDSDVLVIPSYSEGMPNVILEAMARGLIIIATDVGAVNLMVSHQNGILINLPDPSLIKKAIEKILLTEKTKLKQMKINSINKVKSDFTWNKIALITISSLTNTIDKSVKEI
tara:strand:+ start:1439 stop:2602 length:1164 start_codon:yes stop_codon:yes gene_type:complete